MCCWILNEVQSPKVQSSRWTEAAGPPALFVAVAAAAWDILFAMSPLIHIEKREGETGDIAAKERALFARLAEVPSLLIAVSGGADSAYLAWAANQVLGERALSVTAMSPSFSAYDREQLEKFVAQTRVRHEFVETHEFDNPAYRANAGDRCYY